MYDALTIGTVTRDVFLRSSLFKVIHDPKHLRRLGFPTGTAECLPYGSKIEIEKPDFEIGGGGANAAVTFARQGFKTATVVKVGSDYVGKQALAALKKEGIRTFPAHDNKGTAWSCVILSPDGERTILSYRGASNDIRENDVPFKKIKARWAYIVPSDIPFPVMMKIIQALKKQKYHIAMDPSKYYLNMGQKKLRPMLNLLSVVHINREEAALLTGIGFNEEKRIFKKLDELIDGIVAMTDGSRGVIISDGKRLYRAGVYKEKKIADRTGAGDAFGSGFVAGLMQFKNPFSEQAIEYGIRLGSANATSVVEVIGAQPGILRKRDFKAQSRWRKLSILTKNL